MSVRWYVTRTKPMAEYRARDHLEAAGLEVFLPCARARTCRRGHQDMPLFPGYLFLHYDPQGWGSSLLRRIPHLLGLVSFGGEVPAVPDDAVVALAQRVNALNGTGGLWRRYRAGERVRVSLGPIESLADVVEETNSPQARVRVLLEFLGRMVEAKVPWRDVQPVAGSGMIQDGDGGNSNGHPPRRTRGRGRWIHGRAPGMNDAPLAPG